MRREREEMRFGLCCIFRNEPIRFRTTTARVLASLARAEQLERLSAICLDNANNLYRAVETVARLGIGAFRVTSTFFPRYTHPVVGYTLEELPAGEEIRALLVDVDRLRSRLNIRLSFHPDQFVSISSLHDEVVQKSLAELEYQGLVAELIGADVITIHAGGRQGRKRGCLGAVPEQLLPAFGTGQNEACPGERRYQLRGKGSFASLRAARNSARL